MIDLSSNESDPEIASAILGSSPLQTIAMRFNSRAALMRFYAKAISAKHPPIPDQACEFCPGQAAIDGFYVLDWSGTATIYWFRIILFSSIFLPLFVVLHLLPVAIIPHPNLRIGEQIGFKTYHPICRECWHRQRLRQVMAFAATLITGFVLAISFLSALITGAIVVVCLAKFWNYKPHEAFYPGLIFFCATFLCIASKMVINSIPARVLARPNLRHLAKRPFSLADAKLVRRNKIAVASNGDPSAHAVNSGWREDP